MTTGELLDQYSTDSPSRRIFDKDVTTFGVDPFFTSEGQDPKIKEIINEPDNKKRVLKAIAWFDVEHNKRYDYKTQKAYTCNVYARELLEFILGDKIIGSRYHITDGEPWEIPMGGTQYNIHASTDWNSYVNNYPELNANNFAWWMDNHGISPNTPDWIKITDKSQLQKYMKTGYYVGVAVHSQEVIAERKRVEGQNYSGHVAVLVPGIGDGEWGITQSTVNERYHTQYERIFDSKAPFIYYLHKIERKASF